ncbi:Type IV pilus biogenesis protein PilP [Methylophaga frappieri]|uniref:Type IV pilus biogenesis protein PilP n=1 Tax=Methylophaga frappieri (strain ATCC BAA-2434 / DSM 25690 / JAM7) TaxID=754477 RepID=I1YJ34_METFJ|nr:pilus assembly protein PilP [Methylophaga frappieri]AFJ02927.1 Type IV pilus biogenesis protein PilP [Methylophaga frappieri]
MIALIHPIFYHRRLTVWLLALLGAVSLSGCQSEKDDLDAYVKEVKQRSQADIPPIPVMQPYQKFEYAATELRDPFVPTVVDVPEALVETGPDNGIAPDTNRRKEALEFFQLSELRFVGTLEQETLWALVRAPDSVIHKVRVGNYMGMNYGEVTAISESDIKLTEIVPDGNGYKEREAALSVVEIN